MTVLNDLFDYGIKIYQDTDYFKFSLDSILLAEFVKYRKGDNILDLCTGNAPVPLVLATKEQSLKIDGIELQEEVYDLADASVKYNKLEDSIKIIHKDAKTATLDRQYDIVTCNPPYFKVTETSQKNENKIKQIARHEVFINLEEVIHTAKKNLKETGTLYLVHRTERFLETVKLLEKNKLGVRKIAFIFTKENSNAEFFLIEASKYKKSDAKIYCYNINGLKSYQGLFKNI